MVDTELLRTLIKECGYTQKRFAELLGMTEKTFITHMNRGVFDTNQAEQMVKLLNIEDPVRVFFKYDPLKILEVRKQDVPDGRLQKLIVYRIVLRGLVNYHKRMTSTANSPEVEFFDDCYLGALEESLNLINKEIEQLDDSSGKEIK